MNTLKKLLVTCCLCSAMLFTATACKETDNYAVFTSPTVEQQNYETYSWNAIDGATGYVIEIDGVEKGIGNPVMDSMLSGKYCQYYLDTEALGLGVHKIRFAAYKFNEDDGTTKSEWSKEFYVVNELPSAIDYIDISDGEVYFQDLETNSVKLVFNDDIVATYTTPDKLPLSYSTVSLDEFEFSAELQEGVNYNVKAYAVNVFGTSEDYYTTNYLKMEEVDELVCYAMEEGDDIKFAFNGKLNKPFVSLKVNDKEYKVALDSDYDAIYLYEIISALAFEEAIEIYETMIKEDYSVSLKLLSADGITTASEYSNKVECKAKGEEMVANLASSGSVQTSSSMLQVYSPAYIEDYKSFVTISATVTYEDDIVEEIPLFASQENVGVYDVSKAFKFGVNTIKVTQKVNLGGYEVSEELFNAPISINPQVSSVSLSGNSVSWYSNGTNDGYKVKIINSSGSVVETFETTSTSWNVDEYETSGSFNVKVVPVLNGEEGVESPALSITKVSAPSTSLISETLSQIEICGVDGWEIEAEVYDVVNNYTISSNTLFSSDDTLSVNKSTLYNRNAFEIRLKNKGNGINTVDSKETVAKFVLSDCLTFDVKDGEYIKVSGVREEDLYINMDSPYRQYATDGWLDVKEYAEIYDEYSITIGTDLGYISTSSENVIIKPLTISLSSYGTSFIASAPSSIEFDSYYEEFSWSGNSYSKYAYEVTKDGATTPTLSGTTTGPELSVSSLSTGYYTVKIKLLGNGQKLNSFWTEFTYEVLGDWAISTETDTYNDKTRLVVKNASSYVIPVLYESSYSSYTYSRNYGSSANEYYFLLDSDTATYDPYLSYSYDTYYGADYHSELSAKTIYLTSYQIYCYNANSGGYSYKSFYKYSTNSPVEFLRPALESTYYGYYVLGTKPTTNSSYTTEYDYRYNYVIDTDYSLDTYINYFGIEAYLVTFDYSNADTFEGFETNLYYTDVGSEKVEINYAYVSAGTTLKSYLDTYAPLESGYAYYVDAECTQLLDAETVDSAITVYVGVSA